MTIVAHAYPFVIGVDTHARTHTLAILASTGEELAGEQFPATPAGMRRAIAWAGRRTSGDLGALWAVEGIGSYGARLAREIAGVGYEVVEAPRMQSRFRRGTGKSDALDATAIAAATLSTAVTQLRRPRSDDGLRAALRTLVTAREHMTSERTSNVNALIALVRTTELGVDARAPLQPAQIRAIAHWRSRHEDLATATARSEAIRIAAHVIALDQSLKHNQQRMTELIESSPAAPLLEEPGVGPRTAAVLITAWSHPGRVRSEAAFAALAGVNPIPASSGNTVRYRLNRRGDRRLNHALYIAAMTKMRCDPTTRAYVERRLAEGRTPREIRRCLKRYLARHFYRTLNALYAEPTAA